MLLVMYHSPSVQELAQVDRYLEITPESCGWGLPCWDAQSRPNCGGCGTWKHGSKCIKMHSSFLWTPQNDEEVSKTSPIWSKVFELVVWRVGRTVFSDGLLMAPHRPSTLSQRYDRWCDNLHLAIEPPHLLLRRGVNVRTRQAILVIQ